MIKPFLVALQFLTQLPIHLKTQPNDKQIGESLLYYPLVGLLIGSLLLALGWLLSHTPPLVTAALLVTGWVLLTGALHLDGLADSADAWIGGMGDRERTLVIMKDPNCGPAGVVALVLILLLKFVALHSLVIANEWVAILLASVLARTLIPLLFLTTPYARSHGLGLGSPFATHQPRRLSIFVVTATPLLILLLADIIYLWLVITAIMTFLLLRALMIRRLGGATGDTAGALVEITETIVLLAAVLILDQTNRML
jgi:adenosylcobinamide-GDP ribazoletransferase